MRLWILRLHRWSTFALGALFILICGTGAVLVFGDELDRVFRPSLFAATPGDVGPDSALAAMQAAVPDAEVSWLWFPRPERPVYVGALAGRTARHVHVDPGTGQVLGARGEPVINLIRQLHVNLQSGTQGARLVGYLGIALLLMMVSGIYLWWPGLRKMALGFRLRRRGGAALVNYDLHNLTGIITAPLLLLVTITGVAIIFAGPTRVVLHALWLQRPEPVERIERVRVPVPDSGRMQPMGRLVEVARDTMPGYDIMAVILPLQEGSGVQVRMSQPGVRYRDGLVRVILDPYTAEVVRTLDLRSMAAPDAFRRRWMISLHVGEFGGVPLRVVYVLVGLVPIGLAATGLVVWWRRRKGRLALAERRAARAA
jgi:uncharacterized iron-regulated membrane protein